MINNYFYYIIISDGRCYCYNNKTKKLILFSAQASK
jgi:hypothetical protein